MVTQRVNIETMMWSGLMFSPVSPAMEAAVGASSRPITAIMAPMHAGGKITSIQPVPVALISAENKMKIIPNTIKPDCASW